jgi:hypothetical protein
MGRCHPNLLSLLSNGDTNFSCLESTSGSHTSRYTKILDATVKFGAQEQGIKAITPKIMEQQIQGDKLVNPVFTTLWARPDA